jgi:membrane-bound inhibitor of C-type lysozyme
VCDGGPVATARYISSPASVSVTYDGHTLLLQSALSGSGARYTSSTGPHTISPLEWWTKGPRATLSELKSSGNNRLVATCHQIR